MRPRAATRNAGAYVRNAHAGGPCGAGVRISVEEETMKWIASVNERKMRWMCQA